MRSATNAELVAKNTGKKQVHAISKCLFSLRANVAVLEPSGMDGQNERA